MPKYRAKEDILPLIKAGDIVELTEDPIPEYASKLELVGDDEETTEVESTGFVTNPDRNALKARATELEINFASNIPTDRLIELIEEAEAKKRAAEGGSENGE